MQMNSDQNSNQYKYSWAGYLICAFGFLLTIYAFYPGYMSLDSLANLADGRSGNFKDLQSPLFSYLWGKFDIFFPGPALMFILQNILFWSGCAIFWKITNKKSLKLGLSLVLFPLMPQIISQLSTVWKDLALGVSLFLATSLIYYSSQTKSKTALILSAIFLFYGYAARLNALPAVLPIAIWTGFVAFRVFVVLNPQNKSILFRPLLVGFIYFLVLSGSVYFTTYTLTEWKTLYPFQQVYLYDLAAISKDRSEPLFPDYILDNQGFSLENVKSEYNLRSVNSLIFGDRPNPHDPPILALNYEPKNISLLKEKWIEEVKNNPSIYLKHRYFVFAQLVGFTKNTVSNPYWDVGFSTSPVEFQSNPNLLNVILMKYFQLFRKYLFFRAFFWLLLCIFFLYQSIKNKLNDDWEIVFFITLSSLLFTFAYFPTTPSTEFRYLFWTVVSSAIASIFGFYQYLKIENRKQFISRIFLFFVSRFYKRKDKIG